MPVSADGCQEIFTSDADTAVMEIRPGIDSGVLSGVLPLSHRVQPVIKSNVKAIINRLLHFFRNMNDPFQVPACAGNAFGISLFSVCRDGASCLTILGVMKIKNCFRCF